MTAYFPSPYPGELFYSLIARFRHHTLLNQSAVSRLFYGNRDITFSTSLPTQLNSFCSNTSHLLDLKPEDILKQFTIWPYLSCFIKSQSHCEILNCISTIHQEPARLSRLIGLNGSAVHMHRFPKYCPACYTESMQQNGEAFWHREHQLPNMLICATHNCFLKDPDLNFMEVGKNPVLVPTESICSSSMSPNHDVRVSEVANLMRMVLNGDTQLNFNYRQQAVEKGYTRCGFVAQDVLAEHFVKYYTEQTLDRFLQSTIRKVPKLRLDNLVNAPARILNPIKHLLLQNFFRNASPISQQKINFSAGQISSRYTRTKYYRGARAVRMPVRNQKIGRDFREVESRILAQLKNQLTKLKAINGNKRISTAYLCRATSISNSDAQLPRVKAWLVIANESIESFQARRVHKAFLKIRNEGRKLTECNILTRASVWKPSKAILKLVKFLIRTQFEKIPTE